MVSVSATVQRKYESLRRQWKAEEREDYVEVNRKISQQKKYRSRRKRVCIYRSRTVLLVLHITIFMQKYDNRAIVVREGEMKYWQQLSIDFMSEESDDPADSNSLIVHKHPWSSQGMLLVYTYASNCFNNRHVFRSI